MNMPKFRIKDRGLPVFSRVNCKQRVCSLLLLGLSAMAMMSCSRLRTLQYTINSIPQGAYVTMEVRSPGWRSGGEFLGNTPISITRQVDVKACASANEIVLRAMLPGYFDGTKIYSGSGFLKEAKEKGGIFWEFELVPSNRSN